MKFLFLKLLTCDDCSATICSPLEPQVNLLSSLADWLHHLFHRCHGDKFVPVRILAPINGSPRSITFPSFISSSMLRILKDLGVRRFMQVASPSNYISVRGDQIGTGNLWKRNYRKASHTLHQPSIAVYSSLNFQEHKQNTEWGRDGGVG